MGITLIITKAHDREFNETGESITLDEWLAFVDSDPILTLRTDPHSVTAPDGSKITMPASRSQTELPYGDSTIPFLHFRTGDLVMKYGSELDDPSNPARQKVSEIARHFEALITHDAGDEILDW